MKKYIKILGLTFGFVIILYLVWIKLPLSINRYSDIRLGNEIIRQIEIYTKTNGLPDTDDWSTLKKLGLKDCIDFLEPQYQKLNDSCYQLIFIQGFDGPYLQWNSIDNKWDMEQIMFPDKWVIQKPKHEKELVIEYQFIGSSFYRADNKYDLRYDTLVLAFAGNFDFDTINLKYNNIDSTIVITTDEVTGLASDLKLGKIVESKLRMKINNYRPITIDINQENQLFLVEKFDSLLKIQSRYYLPGFY